MAKRGRPPTLDPTQVAADIVAERGNLQAVADRHGVSRTAVKRLCDRHATLRSVLEDAREGMLDHAEARLYQATLDREAWAVCFLLKTQGKSRGYVERQEIDQTTTATLELVEEIVDGPADHPPPEGRPAPPDTV